MTPNPFTALLKSRKFWLAVGDALVSTITIILTMFFKPEFVNQIVGVIALWQPVFVVVIGAIAYEDKAKLQADTQIKAIQATVASTKADVQIQEMKSSDIADIIKK